MTGVVVIIPAFNEENAVGKVIDDIPKNKVDEIIVVNNNSSDRTSEVARDKGVTVLEEPRQGYGRACLKGMDYVAKLDEKPEIVVFLDADYSDYPQQMVEMIQPIKSDKTDFVVGSRSLGNREKKSMTVPQVFGNWLATNMMKLIYNVNYTDLGPFRAIRYSSLVQLDMQDKTYGWTVEMQAKSARHKLRYMEIPVDYRKRIGKSKISGTIKGTVLAGYKIITTILKYT